MSFIVFSWIIFAYLSSTHYLNAIENQKQMLGDYTRFSRMQMAYISNNLGPNAVYENMVEEWRKKSYPGILLSIPFIRDNELGIFNEPIGAFALNNPTLPPTTAELCLAGKFYEKPRNNDKSIRNITFSASRIERPDVTHLLIYERSKLNGALFKRPSEILKVEDDNVWVGLVKTPIDLDHLFVIAFREGGEVCRVSILK